MERVKKFIWSNLGKDEYKNHEVSNCSTVSLTKAHPSIAEKVPINMTEFV